MSFPFNWMQPATSQDIVYTYPMRTVVDARSAPPPPPSVVPSVVVSQPSFPPTPSDLSALLHHNIMQSLLAQQQQLQQQQEALSAAAAATSAAAPTSIEAFSFLQQPLQTAASFAGFSTASLPQEQQLSTSSTSLLDASALAAAAAAAAAGTAAPTPLQLLLFSNLLGGGAGTSPYRVQQLLLHQSTETSSPQSVVPSLALTSSLVGGLLPAHHEAAHLSTISAAARGAPGASPPTTLAAGMPLSASAMMRPRINSAASTSSNSSALSSPNPMTPDRRRKRQRKSESSAVTRLSMDILAPDEKVKRTETGEQEDKMRTLEAANVLTASANGLLGQQLEQRRQQDDALSTEFPKITLRPLIRDEDLPETVGPDSPYRHHPKYQKKRAAEETDIMLHQTLTALAFGARGDASLAAVDAMTKAGGEERGAAAKEAMIDIYSSGGGGAAAAAAASSPKSTSGLPAPEDSGAKDSATAAASIVIPTDPAAFQAAFSKFMDDVIMRELAAPS